MTIRHFGFTNTPASWRGFFQFLACIITNNTFLTQATPSENTTFDDMHLSPDILQGINACHTPCTPSLSYGIRAFLQRKSAVFQIHTDFKKAGIPTSRIWNSHRPYYCPFTNDRLFKRTQCFNHLSNS